MFLNYLICWYKNNFKKYIYIILIFHKIKKYFEPELLRSKYAVVAPCDW